MTDGTTHDATAGDGSASEAATVQLAKAKTEDYLDGVRAALADLPAPEVAEILDDVRAHLADLTAELGGEVDTAVLTARLGPPHAYAAELRAAAGYPPAPQAAARPRAGLDRLALAGLVTATLLVPLATGAGEPGVIVIGMLAAGLGLAVVWREGPRVPGVAALPEVRRTLAGRPAPGTAAHTVVDFLTSLQPAWWVARAFVAATVVVALLADGGAAAAVVLGLLAVPVSVWLGHLTRRDRRWLWPVVPLNGLAAALLLVLLADGASGVFGSPAPASTSAFYQSGLWQDGEREILDIRPFDAAGNPLTGVYLFDQDGRPIDASGGRECDDGYATDGTIERNDPYPRGTRDYDPRTGRCRLTPPGPLVVAVPATPVPAAGPTSGAAPTTALLPGQQTQAPTPPAESAPPMESVPPIPEPAPVTPPTG